MNGQADTGRNDYLDYLKGLLIFLVVYGHTIQFLVYKNSEDFWFDPAFQFIYMFHMPLFMAVSGFVSFGSIARNTVFETIKKRFLQLIVPIFCWEIIYETVVVFAAVAADRIALDRALVVLPRLILKATVDGFWFLQCVFFSSVAVAVLRLMALDRALVFIALCISILFLPDMYVIDPMFRYTFPFFCMGYALAKWRNDVLPLQVAPWWLLPGIAASLACYAVWTRESYVYITGMELAGRNLIEVPFRYVSGAVVSAAFLVLTSMIYRFFRSKTLTALGRASMSIYILQSFFFVVVSGFAPVSKHHVLWSLTAAPVLAILIVLFLRYFGMAVGRFSIPAKLLLGDYKKRMKVQQQTATEV